MGLPPLLGGWFGHPPKEYYCSSNVLACPIEEQGSFAAVIDDALVDVASPMLGCSIIAVVPELLLEGHALLFQVLLLFLELLL